MSSDAAIVTAAGASKRWADKQKKEYVILDGCPVLYWSLKSFLEIEPRLQVVLTLPEADIPSVRALLNEHLDIESLLLIAGGKTRQESVRLGLESLRQHEPGVVLIHDGARPWIDRALIETVLKTSRVWGACIPVTEASEAPKKVGASGLILEDLPRQQIKLAQTPQGFRYSRILDAHNRAVENPRLFFDDAEVYAAYVGPVFTVTGSRANRKITYREDLP